MLLCFKNIIEFVLLLLVFGIMRLVPLDICSIMGKYIGYMAYYLSSRKIIMMDNIQQSYPHLDKKQVANIAYRAYGNFGRLLFEMPHLKKIIHQRTKNIRTPEIEDIIANNPSICFFGCHINNWEIMTSAMNIKMFVVYRAMRNQYIETFLKKYRFASFQEKSIFFPKGKSTIREMVKNIGDYHLVSMIDQRSVRNGEILEFLHRPTDTMDMLSIKLALKNKLPIMSAYCVRSQSFPVRYEIHYHYFDYNLDELPKDNIKAQKIMMQKICDFFTQYIDKNPHSWFWLHDLWKRY